MTQPAPRRQLPFWVLPLIVCVVLAGAGVGAALLVHHLHDRQCLVLVTGNKICGDDAKTWCEMTASDRQAAQDADAQFGVAADDDCDAILAG